MKNAENIFDNLEEEFGEEKLDTIMEGMLSMLCATGDIRAKTMKNFHELAEIRNDIVDNYFMPNLKDDKKADKCYKLSLAMVEFNKNLINDFKENF